MGLWEVNREGNKTDMGKDPPHVFSRLIGIVWVCRERTVTVKTTKGEHADRYRGWSDSCGTVGSLQGREKVSIRGSDRLVSRLFGDVGDCGECIWEGNKRSRV